MQGFTQPQTTGARGYAVTAIGPIDPQSAAAIRAAALAAISHERPISAADRYAGELSDTLPTLKEGASLTITNTLQGTTVDGEPIAAWIAGLGSDQKMNYAPAASTPAKPSVTDTVTLSPQAQALIERQSIALAVMTKADPGADPTKTDEGVARPGQATPAAAAATTTANTTGHIFHTAAEFQAAYAAQAADGVDGRFYDGTDVDSLAPIMSDDEFASFKAAFDSRSLTIQSASTAPGVQWSGSEVTTFSETAIGGGESMSSEGQGIDLTAFMTTTKYALISYDPFFGPTIISWGGPPDASVSDVATPSPDSASS